MSIEVLLLAAALMVVGILLRPVGWVVFALAALTIVLHLFGVRVH